jgi:hypothetical protein
VEPRPDDPFGEAFDEEEVVLDSFAAWENMFLSNRIRVENRRDPAFAAIVQNAMDASAAEASPVENAVAQTSPAARLMTLPAGEESDKADAHAEAVVAFADVADETESLLHGERNVPPLRLADVPEVVPLSQFPLIAPSPVAACGGASFDPVLPEDDDTSDWPSALAIGRAANAEFAPTFGRELLSDAPVLVIEEDAPDRPVRKQPARRQEYRHLFSRLRSG